MSHSATNNSEPVYTVVTGASRGIGATFAYQLARRDSALILAARSAEGLQRVCDAVGAHGQAKVVCVACDLSTPVGVDALLAACAPLRIGGLVNNAGVGLGGEFTAHGLEELSGMLFLNMQALTMMTHALSPKIKQERGFIINVASYAAFVPVPYLAAYAASKAYVLHFTEALHREMLPFAVRVQALCPAATQTSFFEVAGVDLTKTKFKLGGVDAVVQASFKALGSNQAYVIPGWQSRWSTYASRFLPRSWACRLAQNFMGH